MPKSFSNAEVDGELPTAFLYVVGEMGGQAEEENWPVKIGWSANRRLDGFQVANWREVKYLHRVEMPLADVVGVEFTVHQHLAPWWTRGEWFRVREVSRELGGWPKFIDAAIRQAVPGGQKFELVSADGDERLDSILRLGKSHFLISCTCGHKLERRGTLPMAVERFATDHLKIEWARPAALRRRARRTTSRWTSPSEPDEG